MPPIPPPRAHGFTTTTPVPLYWAEYGDPGAPPLLLLHGGPGASHDYLLPQMLALAEDHRAGLLRPARRRALAPRRRPRRHRLARRRWPTSARVAAELRVDAAARSSATRGAGCSRCSTPSRRAAGRVQPPRRAPRPHRPGADHAADPPRSSSRSSRAGRRARRSPRCATELQASGLRERDPDAYRQRAFELSVAGYFADPARARDLTPFRVTGRVQQSIWQSLGDYDLRARARARPRAGARRARTAGPDPARVVRGGGACPRHDVRRPGGLRARPVRRAAGAALSAPAARSCATPEPLHTAVT